MAVMAGDVPGVRDYLARHADPNYKSLADHTPLYSASQGPVDFDGDGKPSEADYIEIARSLIHAGARDDLSACSKTAASWGHQQLSAFFTAAAKESRASPNGN